MKRTFSVIKINPLFWFIVGIGVLTGYFREIVMIFSIVFIHELGHVFAASYYKWKINKIELLPFGGVAEVENIDNRPFHEELIVILSGPLQHVWMVLFSYLCLFFPFWSEGDHRLFVLHNLIILGFNLLPVLPLDGGRLLQLWFTYRHSYLSALHYARVVSAVFLVGAFISSLLFFPFHLNLWVVLLFLIISNYMEWKQRHYRFIRFLMARLQSANCLNRNSVISVRDSLPIREAMKLCRRGYTHHFKVMEVKKGSFFFVTEDQLLNELFTENKPYAPLSSFSLSETRF